MADQIQTVEQPNGGGVTRVSISEGETSANAPAERPAWLPEKFQSPEDMAKAYSELEKTQGSRGQEPLKTEPKQEAKAPVAIPGVASELVSKYSNELLENGDLSQASYDELAKVGYTKEMVTAYIRGMQTDQIANDVVTFDREVTKIKQAVGGDEGFAEMSAWAKANLSEPELKAYNAQIDSGDIDAMRLAVEGLQSRYRRDNPKQPKLHQGGRSTGEVGFGSVEEMTNAIRDPRYASDPSYRNQVIQRVAASKLTRPLG